MSDTLAAECRIKHIQWLYHSKDKLWSAEDHVLQRNHFCDGKYRLTGVFFIVAPSIASNCSILHAALDYFHF